MVTFGLDVPAYQDTDVQASYRQFVTAAEEADVHNLWVGDHLLWHQPRFETFVLLGMLSGMTELTLGSGIALAPLRPAWWTAKAAASIARTAQGGFVLGLGAGGEFAPEFELARVDPRGRGGLVDDTIALCRSAWAGEIEGFSPLPESPIPIWLAGRKAFSLRRVAARAEGWLGLFLDPGEFHDASIFIGDAAESLERPRPTMGITLWISIGNDDDAARATALARISNEYKLPQKAFARHVVAGTAAQVAAQVDRYIDAGAEHISFHIAHPDPVGQVRLLGQDVLPTVRPNTTH